MNIINNFKTYAQSTFGETLTNFQSQPIAELRSALLRYKQQIFSSTPLYEDVVLGLLTCATNAQEGIEDVAANIVQFRQEDLNALYSAIEAHGEGVVHTTRRHQLYVTIPSGYVVRLTSGFSFYNSTNYILLELFKQTASGLELLSQCDVGFNGAEPSGLASWNFSSIRTDLPSFTFADFTAWMVESSECNDLITSAIDALSSPTADVLGLLRSLQDTVYEKAAIARSHSVEKFSSLKNFIAQVIAAYSSGGIKAAIVSILRWADAMKGLSLDENGLMVFTDNESYVPKTYIAGMITKIFSAAVTVLGTIVSIFSRVVGPLLIGAGTLLWNVGASIAGDYASTRASMNASEFVDAPWGPTAAYRIQFSAASIEGTEILATLRNSTGMLRVRIPFGYALLGCGPNDTILCECHPDLCDRRDLFATYFKPYVTMNEGATGHLRDFTISIPDISTAVSILTSIINGTPSAINLGNQVDGALSVTDDYRLRKIYHLNLFGMIWWLKQYNQPTHYTYLGPLSGSTYLTVNGTSVGLPQGDTRSEQSCFENLVAMAAWFVNVSDAGDPMLQWATLTKGVFTNSTDIFSLGGFDLGNDRFISYLAGEDDDNVGYITPLTTSSAFAFNYPSYDAGSFWTVVALTVVTAIVITVAAVIATVQIKRKLAIARAKSAADVEKAWADLTEDPTNVDKAKAYYKTVKRANLKALVIGGTKYDSSGFWNGDPTDSGESPASGSSILNQMMLKTDTVDSAPTIATVIKLIAGDNLS